MTGTPSPQVFHVHGSGFNGYGPTPGLALRHFWRTIEAAVIAGRPAPWNLLPTRRQYALHRRANHA